MIFHNGNSSSNNNNAKEMTAATSSTCSSRRWCSYGELSLLMIISMFVGFSIHAVLLSATTNTSSPMLGTSTASSSKTQHNQSPSSHVACTSTTTSKKKQQQQVDDDNGLKIAWLMSFPNSGTSYTIRLVRTISRTQAASNYGTGSLGGKYNETVPVFDDSIHGPFIVDPNGNPNYEMPKHYILTKTHCGYRCERCGPNQYVETTYSFRKKCLTGSYMKRQQNDGNLKQISGMSYPSERVKKAIHLIRNPFDNIVSRFHLQKKDSKKGVTEYDNTPQGFRDFCHALNEKYVDDELKQVWMSDKLHNLTATIPCRAEFFRYTEWHNMVLSTIHDMDLDTYILKYDWYETRFWDTTNELLDFLKLENVGGNNDNPSPFKPGKKYAKEYFTKEERKRMEIAMQYMSSPILWEYIQEYF